MPGNQPSTTSSHLSSSNQSKSSLVRSKSLRLPTSKPKTEQVSSTLTRHGSIRGPRNQSSTLQNSKSSHLSLFKKPLLKPKPHIGNSKSSESLEKSVHNADGELKKTACRSPNKHIDGKGVTFTDMHPSPSDSPTSLHSDKSQSQDANSWCTTDLVAHLRRLTEEHEKLQVEYARLRIQLVENVAFHPVSLLRRDQQHLSHSDSHLASIPENCSDTSASVDESQQQVQVQETLIQNYRSEIFRLQEENRKIQRKYWEQVLNSELIEDEACNGASQQVVDLIDKLDEKEKELVEVTGRVQELENHLATTNLELQQCQEALQEKQLYLDEAVSHREELAKQLRECRASLNEARENIDFLQAERSTLAEAFQETEQSLLAANSEMMKDKSKVNELMDRARKLYAKVQDKNLQVQLLRAELDRTQGNCRDMLLSQGAELTMISMHLSQMSMNVHTLLTTAADFAANELALQKEMLEEVMIDLDSEGERSESPVKQNGILNSDSQIPSAVAFSSTNSFSNEKHLDTHKSLPDISAYEPGSPLYSSASSESERPLSLVQSMVRAFEQSTKNDPKSLKQIVIKSYSEQNSDSVKSSVENLSSINGDLSRISSPSKDNSPVASSAFKPIGMATAFRPVRQQSVESDIPFSDHLNYEEEKKISLEIQLNQIDSLVKKVGRVIELMEGKFLSKMRVLNDEKNTLQEELSTYKHKQCQLQAELNIKNDLIKNAKEQTEELLTQLQQVKNSHAEEKEKILQKNIELTEKISCLEAVNAEQTEQIKNEVQRMMSILVAEPNSEFLSNAQAICDKLNLKQEIAKLKATISQKEVIIQQLAQKFKRATTTLEEDLRKAEKEIRFLDNVIGKVFVVLQSNPDLVQNHEAFRNLMSLVSGNCTLSSSSSVSESEDK